MLWMHEISHLPMRMMRPNIVWYIRQSRWSTRSVYYSEMTAFVYQQCRRKYCNPHQIAKDTNQEESMPSTSSNGRPVLQSSEEEFLVIFGGIHIDPLLLFQRLTTVMQSSDGLELAFKHKLCSSCLKANSSMICTAHTCTAQLMLKYELCSSYFMLSLIPL